MYQQEKDNLDSNRLKFYASLALGIGRKVDCGDDGVIDKVENDASGDYKEAFGSAGLGFAPLSYCAH